MRGDTLNPNEITQQPHMGGDTSNPTQTTQHPPMGGRHFKPQDTELNDQLKIVHITRAETLQIPTPGDR